MFFLLSTQRAGELLNLAKDLLLLTPALSLCPDAVSISQDAIIQKLTVMYIHRNTFYFYLTR